MPKSKHKHLHFAGYDFTSGPEGTVVHRKGVRDSAFHSGDRVQYRNVNLTQQGTVSSSDGKWVMVRWDGYSFESKEWAPNLRHVSTGASHATKKKSPAQLQREINEVLGARGTRDINRRKEVRHFSDWKDKTGQRHLSVTYVDLSSHPITAEEYERYYQREKMLAPPRRHASKKSARYYVAHPDEVAEVTIVFRGLGDYNVKRRYKKPVRVRNVSDGDEFFVEESELFSDPVAASIRSAELAG